MKTENLLIVGLLALCRGIIVAALRRWPLYGGASFTLAGSPGPAQAA